jgi:hypothetical protein
MRLARWRTWRLAAEIARPAFRDPSSVSSLLLFSQRIYKHDGITSGATATHSRAPPWIPPYDENLSILPSPRMGRHRARTANARGDEMPPGPLCVRTYHTRGTPQVAKLPSFINYWVRMTPPHGLKIGGLGMGCRKNAWYCPFRDPEPTI